MRYAASAMANPLSKVVGLLLLRHFQHLNLQTHHLQLIQNYKAQLDIWLESVKLFNVGLKLLH